MHFHQQPGMKNQYYNIAREAAELEQDHQYKSAAILWRQVANIASHPDNITWAEKKIVISFV